MYDPYSWCEGCEVEPKEEWEEQIFEIIHDVVKEKCKDIKDSLNEKQDKINEQSKQIQELKKNIKGLEEKLRVQVGMDKFVELVSEDNIFNLINSLGIEQTNTENYIRGMDSERIPTTTRLAILYYDNRETIFDLFDLFSIDYPTTLREFRLPRDYSKKEVEDIINNVDRKMLNTNGCYFKDNFGFWLAGSFGNKEGRVPLQEVFQNPRIKDCTDIIINTLKDDKYSYYSYLYEVTNYQTFPKEIIFKLAKYLPENPDKFHTYHKNFIERHKDILFDHKDFCERYFEYARSSKYGIFSIHNFNRHYQGEFIEGLKLENAIALINELNYNEEEKTEMIKKVIK